jgi:hypothetical protein
MKSSKIIADMALSAPLKPVPSVARDPKAFLDDLKEKLDWVEDRAPLRDPYSICGWQIAILLATSSGFRGAVSSESRHAFDGILAEEQARIQILFAPKVENQNLKKCIYHITQL